MNKIIFNLNELLGFSNNESGNINFSNLGYFLRFGCGSHTSEYIDWLLKTHQSEESIGLNECEMRINGENVYILIDAYGDEGNYSNRKTEAEKFTTTRDQMIQILTEWYRIINMKLIPDEVHLIQDGDKVWLEIKN